MRVARRVQSQNGVVSAVARQNKRRDADKSEQEENEHSPGRLAFTDLERHASDFTVVAGLHYLADIVGEFATLSVRFQEHTLDIKDMLDHLDAMRRRVMAQYCSANPTWGRHAARFLSKSEGPTATRPATSRSRTSRSR